MVTQEQFFHQLEKSKKGEVKVANGQFAPALGSGTVILKLPSGKDLVLRKVLFVPDLDENLISERQLDKRGFHLNTKNGRKVIGLNDVTYGIGEWSERHKMYRLPAAVCRTATAEMWHRRFGHVLSVPPIVPATRPDRCETCELGKTKRQPFPKSDSRAVKVLDLIHTDVGEMQTRSLGGNKYFITFIDDRSRYSEVYPMKKKSESLEKFKLYKAKVENLHGTRIKVLQSDNGGEYIAMDGFLAENGILPRRTVAKTPQSNARAERLNQTLQTITRCANPSKFGGNLLGRGTNDGKFYQEYLPKQVDQRGNSFRSLAWKKINK